MLFQKPKNMKYTDMCIYIDGLVARGNPTEAELNLAFQYLYHLAYMLAHKHKYFNRTYYYEEFAVYFATEIMNRLFYNPRLDEVSEEGEPILTPIKSVLNYMKGVIYGRKVAFEQQTYSQKYTDFEEGEYLYSFNQDPFKALKETDIQLYLQCVAKTAKHIVYEKNHYKKDKVLMKNIYLSCLLTVLNGLTFSNADLHKLNTTYTSIDSKYRLLARLYATNRQNSLTLYHLKPEMESYIRVLSNKIYKQLKDDLRELSGQSFAISDAALTNILFLEVKSDDDYYGGE